MIESNFIKLYEKSFRENWDLPAFTDLNESTTITYSDFATNIGRLHILFEEMGLKKKDKVALIGRNHTAWAAIFMATITYGAVIVPVLHEFHPDSMENIILHSDAKLIFIDENTLGKLNTERFTYPIISIPNWDMVNRQSSDTDNLKATINKKFAKRYINGFKPSDIQYPRIHNDTVICLNYTSGTTGFSKGVMLTANNYAGNVVFAERLDLLLKGESIVAFLPMAHAYGCAFDFLYALSAGVHIHLLGKNMSPTILLDAFQKVKPKLIITVPLILEKIYQKKILPIISKPTIQSMLKVPFLRNVVYSRIRKTLMASFGGEFKEIIIGGAAMSKEAESFFHKVAFPFTIGYGMTECAPLISYDKHQDFVPTSCGRVLEGIMEARIDSDEPTKIPGEIQVRGENVMKGYYKNPSATDAAFTEDGWLRTGDLGIIDNENRLYIKGRLKTMLLGANGQNIFPEEIEARLKNMSYVAESLIIKRQNRLVALVYPDIHEMEETNVTFEQLESIMNNNRLVINKRLASYEQINYIELRKDEFEKTPKKSIKRFMYVEDNGK
ncbi:MAG: long-chain fatty acid--CoA ligase [Bacteroidales bacterium]|nr:long-chain fatty acid--CoA ligase [Bacteroidales bacterium]